MKSNKYELLKSDYDHVCEQLKIHKKIIEELRNDSPTVIQKPKDMPATIIKWQGVLYRSH